MLEKHLDGSLFDRRQRGVRLQPSRLGLPEGGAAHPRRGTGGNGHDSSAARCTAGGLPSEARTRRRTAGGLDVSLVALPGSSANRPLSHSMSPTWGPQLRPSAVRSLMDLDPARNVMHSDAIRCLLMQDNAKHESISTTSEPERAADYRQPIRAKSCRTHWASGKA